MAVGDNPGGTAVVVTVSTRAANGEYADLTGPVVVHALREWGWQVADPIVVPDGPQVKYAVERAIAEAVSVVLTTGGTGISPTDQTPELIAPLLTKPTPGVIEAIRAKGLEHGARGAALTRGVAGVAGHSFVVTLPGSMGGVRDSLDVLRPLVAHAVEQLRTGAGHDDPENGSHV